MRVSLRWQVVALVLASVTAAQAAAFGALLLFPPPEPLSYAVDLQGREETYWLYVARTPLGSGNSAR